MVEETANSVRIDLNQFKLQLCLKPKVELTLHFDTPSRKFYLSVIGLVVHEMKKKGRITSISLQEHLEEIALLNQTVGGAAGSSDKVHLLSRIYRKWKDALPDLENAPLFKVVGRKKRYDDSLDRIYGFSEGEKDSWANLFEYKGSHEHVRLRFSIDRLGSRLDDVIIVFGEYPEPVNGDAWEGFIASLKEKCADDSRSEPADQEYGVPWSPLMWPRRWISSMPGRWQWAMRFALIGLVAGAVAIAAWKFNFFAPRIEVASIEKMAFPLPDKPSIAVLPFRDLSEDPKQDYFSDGLTDDLITDLSKISGLFVIARNSTFAYKGKPIKIRQVAEELGVRYVLEGSVRRVADRIRINAQLIDATTGGHLWAERYDGNLGDVFSLQDNITRKIVFALAIKLSQNEEAEFTRKDTIEIPAYDAFLKGWAHYVRHTPGDFARAVQYFEKAVELDPNYGRAYAALAATYWESFNRFWHESLNMEWHETLLRAAEYIQLAMKKNPTPLAHSVTSKMLVARREYDEAIAETERALALDPNDANNFISMAYALIYVGKPTEAVSYIEKAMRIDPDYPAYYLFIRGLAYFGMEQFEKAASLFEKALERNPENYVALIPLAATYAHLNREKEARDIIVRLNKFMPIVTLAMIEECPLWHYKNQVDRDRLMTGLDKAGMAKTPYDLLE